MDAFINLQLSKNGRLLLSVPRNFQEILAENHCDCKKIRPNQILPGVTVLKTK